MKKLKDPKKAKVKGMTLIECIIALLVFGVMALMMARIVTITSSLLMNTNHQNNKTAVEAPVAAIRKTDNLTNPTDVVISVKSSAGVVYETVPVRRYSTKDLIDPSDPQYQSGLNADLYFYDIVRSTEPTT